MSNFLIISKKIYFSLDIWQEFLYNKIEGLVNDQLSAKSLKTIGFFIFQMPDYNNYNNLQLLSRRKRKYIKKLLISLKNSMLTYQ